MSPSHRRRWIYFSIMFLTMASVAIAGVDYLGKAQVDPVVQSYIAVQNKHLALFREDQTFLERFAIFKAKEAASEKSDAGPFLNPRLVWSPSVPDNTEGTASEKPAEKKVGAPELLSIPTKLSEKILRLRNDWMRHHTRLLKSASVDFSLLEQLSRFDHWDIESNSPIGKLREEGRFIPPESLPTPETIHLLILAKLRLAAGAETRQPLIALEQVRQLANLLLTTENMNLMLAGLAVLDIERLGFRFYIERDMLSGDTWTPVPRNITRRASRAIRALRGYLHIWTEPSLLKQIFLEGPVPAGFCAAINENMPKILGLRPLLEPQWPLERPFHSEYAMMDPILKRADQSCRIRYVRRMGELGKYASDYPRPGFLSIFPYTRKIFALRAETVPFLGFEAYEENSKPNN